MNRPMSRLARGLRVAAWLTGLIGAASLTGAIVAQDGAVSMASLSNETAASYVAQPLTSGTSAVPIVMLGLSVDEQLYRRAYDDVSDLDGDGLLDTGYRNTLDYLGYFDPSLCYAYASGRYKAAAAASGESRHQCLAAAAGNWSGNFLNWLSMSRLDVLRAALYGGRRSTDSSTVTVLERSYVPADFHAWAKFYDGADANLYTPFTQDAGAPGLSFCNVSFVAGGDVDSASSTAAPQLRVARGSFRLWAAAETRECLWNEESGSADQPTRAAASLGEGEYLVRAEVCDPAAPATQREAFCRQYPNGLKPAGQLQRFGEDGQLQFGLLSGSYAKPRSGGQLRRNAGPLVGNGDGNCAAGDEINLATGQFCIGADGAAGIVNTVDRLRIARYRSTDGDAGYSDCDGKTINRGSSGPVLDNPGSGSNTCTGWGNPLAEIYGEILRYIAGEPAPTTAFTGDDARSLPGLPTATWRDAYAHTEHCAECSVVMLASGSNSFDSDEIPPVAALGGAIAGTATDAIGSNESLAGPALLGRIGLTPLGNSPTTNADRCSVKTLGALSQARGICPAAPAQEGSYLIAGLAHRAWTGDLRPDNGAAPASAGQQRARNYGLQFSGALPGIPVLTSAGQLIITPACEANPLPTPTFDDSQWHSCSYGSMTPGAIRNAAGQQYGRALSADGRAGSFLIAWNDASYGGSQQRDLLQMLSWCVGAACAQDLQAPAGPDICAGSDSTALCTAEGQLARSIGEDEVLVRVELIAGRDADTALLGYTISGAVTGNGVQRLVRRQRGDNGNLLAAAQAQDASERWSRPKVSSYTPGAGPGRVLESPLFYAAKYGGYDYPAGAAAALPSPGTGASTCTDTAWDHLNNASDAGGADCIPDNYFALANPARLKDRLGAVFNSILRRSGSGGVAAVLSGSGAGPGAVYQTSYNVSRSDSAGRKLVWVGNLQALFVDSDGRLREDGNGNAQLDEADYSAAGDPVVELYYDAEQRLSRFRRYSANPGSAPDSFTVIDDLSTLRTIWNARRALSAVGDVATQRDYSTPASSGRYLFTFVDFDLDGRAEAGEQLALSPANFGAGRYGLLNVGSAAAAEKLIRYTRGEEFPSLRNRTVDDDGDGRPEVLRLGDIVNSVPLTVAAPAESYDLIYGDRTYAEFFNRYRGRRNVVYVGANDGLLHAFNAGFYQASTKRFLTTPSDSGGVTAHPLGSELWAYAPFNLLPQLGWLADPRYGHLWTMDGSPRAFDVRAFANDATHPNGWGTLLVIGMRLGGGPVTIPNVDAGGSNRDAVSDFAVGLGSSSTLSTRSAFVVLDVTDPEQPPVLIAEYSDRNGRLGYTTSNPAVAAFARRNASSAAPPAEDRWYLVFGSGPTSLSSATSNQDGFLFGIDLKRLLLSSIPVADTLIYNGPYDLGNGPASGAPLSLVGDPVAVDWDLNFRADALYFGTAGGSTAAPTGKLFKLDFNLAALADSEGNDPSGWRTPAVLLDTRRPLLAAPSLTQDRSGRRWVLSGTGRFLAPGDKTSSAEQALFGLIDNAPASASPAFANLVDTSSAVVTPSGAVTGVSGVSSEIELTSTAAAAGGWRYMLSTSPTTAAERNISRTALIDGLLFASSYTPSASLCSGDGNSRLFGFNYLTGAPRAQRPAFGVRRVTVSNAEIDSSAGIFDLGLGLGSAPSLHVDDRDGSGLSVVTVNVQTSRGSVVQQDVRVSGGVRSGEIDWRQTHRNQ
ncbi:pilus assembly protein [Nevskia ramosa]|uniref:pilus assembly protein n=1 Tax=Nevskia ramosa TaxID=64002 RepID=UPI003D135BF1